MDLGRLASLVDATDLRRATPEEARGATGFAVGGTPPFGYPDRIEAFVDENLLTHETVWAAAGTPDSVFPLAPANLRRITGATPRAPSRRAERLGISSGLRYHSGAGQRSPTDERKALRACSSPKQPPAR